MKMRKRSLTGLAVLTARLLAGSTVAHALTTEVRVVSAFTGDFGYVDEFGELVLPEADSGWMVSEEGTGTVEIGSAYGVPDGLGREALMLDTPTAGDSIAVDALTVGPWNVAAFAGDYLVTSDRRIGFWLYLSSASTAESSPVLQAWITVAGTRHEIVTFDPIANGHVERDTWMEVDATADGATWTVRRAGDPDAVEQTKTWDEIVDYTHTHYNGVDYPGAFDYSVFTFLQDTPGTYSAIDGVTFADNEWSTTTNFELGGRPMLDTCKNNGWSDNYPTSTFKNQGACIATIVAAN